MKRLNLQAVLVAGLLCLLAAAPSAMADDGDIFPYPLETTKLDNGLLELDPQWNTTGWLVLMGIGFVSAFLMWLYNRWLKAHPA